MRHMTEILSYLPLLPFETVIILCICKRLLTLMKYTHNIIITKMLLKNGKRHGRISENDIYF